MPNCLAHFFGYNPPSPFNFLNTFVATCFVMGVLSAKTLPHYGKVDSFRCSMHNPPPYCEAQLYCNIPMETMALEPRFNSIQVG